MNTLGTAVKSIDTFSILCVSNYIISAFYSIESTKAVETDLQSELFCCDVDYGFYVATDICLIVSAISQEQPDGTSSNLAQTFT